MPIVTGRRWVDGWVILLAVGLVCGMSGCTTRSESPSPPTSVSVSAPAPEPAETGPFTPAVGAPSKVVAKIDVGGSPCGVAVAAGSAWVSDAERNSLVQIDLGTNTVTGRQRISAAPCEILVADRSLWIVTQSGVVDRVDPRTGKVVARIPVGATSYEAAAAFGSIWVSNRSDGTLTRIDPSTNKVIDTVAVPDVQPGGIVAADGALWIGNDTGGASFLIRLDPDTGAVTKIDAGERPAYVTATPGKVWTSDGYDGTVSTIDTQTSEAIGDPVPAGAYPVNLEATPDGTEVWVPDDEGDTLTRIDATSGDVVERLAVGRGPAVVAATDADIWVTNFEGGSVWRITPS